MPTQSSISLLDVNRLVRWSVVAVFCGVITTPAIARNAPEQRVTDLAKTLGWTYRDRAALEQTLSSNDVVGRFLDEIMWRGKTDPELKMFNVKQYRFIDMFGDGWLELVVLADPSGRGNYSVDVVEKSHDSTPMHKPALAEYGGFAIRDIPGLASSLEAALRDLDGDGLLEVITYELLDEYRGLGASVPKALLPSVFKWNGYQFANVTSQFGWYYEQVVIPQLEIEAHKLEAKDELGLSPDQLEQLHLQKAASAKALAEARRRAAGK